MSRIVGCFYALICFLGRIAALDVAWQGLARQLVHLTDPFASSQ